jgi:Domain of unknown function (DUF4267)
MSHSAHLTADSVLFWITVLLATGIVFIGIRFIVAPRTAAAAFGAPVASTASSTYLWTKGTRDIVSGLLVAALLCLKVSATVLAVFLLVASLMTIGDLLNVYAHVRMKNVPALIIHGGTAPFMCILAVVLLQD